MVITASILQTGRKFSGIISKKGILGGINGKKNKNRLSKN